ncbi:hypothetical protein BGX20_007536 [Mortierella sp. AD010]|nr:hypothetical protein BGX20_007536 [Mortierella sp. AD010]
MSTPSSIISTATSSVSTTTSAPASTSAATQPITTTASSTPTSSTLPVDPNTSTVSPSPAPATDTKTSNGGGGKTKTSKSYGSGTATISGGPSSSNTPGDNGDNNSSNDTQGGGGSKIIGPVVGSICGVLVLAFIVGVFVMRYRKKSKARKRRLDFLNDHGNTSATITSSQHQDSPGLPAAALARPSTPSGGRPSNLGGRPMEMTAVGGGMAGAAHVPNEGYDYQPGYQQQAKYGGYQEQYDQNDQYDPYYAQRQNYYPEQQQQYPQQQYQQQQYQQQYQQQQYPNQFAPPAVIGGSPAMTHASTAYPPPPPSTITGGHSSPRTPQQSNVDVASYEKNAISETGYTPNHSQSRNPQLVPENEERIKVPV